MRSQTGRIQEQTINNQTMKRLSIITCLMLALSGYLRADKEAPISPERLTEQSELVVQGKVAGVVRVKEEAIASEKQGVGGAHAAAWLARGARPPAGNPRSNRRPVCGWNPASGGAAGNCDLAPTGRPGAASLPGIVTPPPLLGGLIEQSRVLGETLSKSVRLRRWRVGNRFGRS